MPSVSGLYRKREGPDPLMARRTLVCGKGAGIIVVEEKNLHKIMGAREGSFE